MIAGLSPCFRQISSSFAALGYAISTAFSMVIFVISLTATGSSDRQAGAARRGVVEGQVTFDNRTPPPIGTL
jgi:hypothetical protein